MSIKFGASIQWWQFDHHNTNNLSEEVEILKSWGLTEVRVITPSPPTWGLKKLCSDDYAESAQYAIVSALRSAGISTTFCLANSLSSVTELLKLPEYNHYYIARGNNDYEATVDLIHDAIIHNDNRVLDKIHFDFNRYGYIYDKCQLINAGELFMFNSRNHLTNNNPKTGVYNIQVNIQKFFDSFKRKSVFWDSANIYLQGEDYNGWMSCARPFGFSGKPLKYISEFNVTGVNDPETRAKTMDLCLRKIIYDYHPSVICFHTPLGGWFVLDENKDVHKLWSTNGIQSILDDMRYRAFERDNPIMGEKNSLFFQPVLGEKLQNIIKQIRRKSWTL